MYVRSFRSSLLFGAVAAMTVVFSGHVLAPIVGGIDALILHLVVALVAYGALIARDLRGAARNVALAAPAAIVVGAMAQDPATAALGLTMLLSLVRTGLVPERRSARAVALEAGLGTTALLFAGCLAWPGWLGWATALWGYALVQSLFFLVPVTPRPGRAADEGDPFDRARGRLLAMLDEA